MEFEFWHQRWEAGQIGFHMEEVNPFLKRYFAELKLSKGDKVLVPLCGKSVDLVWLWQQGLEVCGVELSPLAVRQFQQEQDLPLVAQPQGAFEFWHLPQESGQETVGLGILCGDFFQLTAEQCREVKAVYDRAALVALPLEMRVQYVAHLQQILPAGTKILLVTMDYDQSLMQGPPFAVSKAEVHHLFSQAYRIEQLAEVNSQRKGHPIKEEVFVIELA